MLGSTPEVEMYAYLLVLMFLVDHKQYDQVGASSAAEGVVSETQPWGSTLVEIFFNW